MINVEISAFRVTATAPDLTEVSVERSANRVDALFPMRLEITRDVTEVVAGSLVHWSLSGTNIADFPLDLSSFQARLEPSAMFTPLSSQLVDRGDGDDLLGPAETWRWTFAGEVTVDGSFDRAAIPNHHRRGGERRAAAHRC